MNKDCKILIQGGYGFHNWGDDLQLWNNVRILKEKGFNNLTIMTPNSYVGELCKCTTTVSGHSIFSKSIRGTEPELFRQFCLIEGALLHKKTSILNKNHQLLIKKIEECDVLFFSGSGTINTRHSYGLMVFLTPIMIASYFNKPVILSGQGFTPMNNRKLEKFIGVTLNKVTKIFTRDFEEGLKALRKTKIDMKKVEKSIDDAFTSPISKVELPKLKHVGINISCFIVPALHKEFYDLGKLLQKNGYVPVFNYFQSEDKLLEIITKGDFAVRKFTYPEEVTTFHKHLIGNICMRYHSMILSIAQETPVVNISRDEYQVSKVKAIINETAIPNISLRFAETKVENMYSTLMKAIESQPPKLKEINEKWRPKANLAINYLENSEENNV